MLQTQKSTTYVFDGGLVIEELMNEAWSMGIDSRWIRRGKTFCVAEPTQMDLRTTIKKHY